MLCSHNSQKQICRNELCKETYKITYFKLLRDINAIVSLTSLTCNIDYAFQILSWTFEFISTSKMTRTTTIVMMPEVSFTITSPLTTTLSAAAAFPLNANLECEIHALFAYKNWLCCSKEDCDLIKPAL